jgi:hypothetical protein
MAAMASGVLFGAMAARGLVDGNDVIGLVAVNAAANWLHETAAKSMHRIESCRMRISSRRNEGERWIELLEILARR